MPFDMCYSYLSSQVSFSTGFKLQLLLPQKQSEANTQLAIADVNNDGLDDFFVGNSKNTKASLFIQKKTGHLEVIARFYLNLRRYMKIQMLYF